jgi:hypothetical protein
MLEVSPKVVSVKAELAAELAAGGAMVGAAGAGVVPVPAGTPPEPEMLSVVLLMVGVGVVDDSAEPGTGTTEVETVV